MIRRWSAPIEMATQAVQRCRGGLGVGLEAVNRLGEQAGGRGLAGAARAAEEVGVADSVEPTAFCRVLDDVLLPDQLLASKDWGRYFRYKDDVDAVATLPARWPGR